MGAEIVRRALPYSLKLIARNAGTNGSVVVQKVRGVAHTAHTTAQNCLASAVPATACEDALQVVKVKARLFWHSGASQAHPS